MFIHLPELEIRNFWTCKNIVDFKSLTAGHNSSPTIEHWEQNVPNGGLYFPMVHQLWGSALQRCEYSFFQPLFLITCRSWKPVCFLLSALPQINMDWQKICQLTNLTGRGNFQWKVANWTWIGLRTSYNILPARVHVKPTFKNRDPTPRSTGMWSILLTSKSAWLFLHNDV